MQAPYSCNRDIQGFRPDTRLSGDQLKGTGQLLPEQFGSSRTICMPPVCGFPNLVLSFADNQ